MALRKILQADIVRMQATKPENTSLAAAYFKNRPMHNSTHISASRIKAETGNIPERDMFNTFNMGVGMTVIVAEEDVEKTLEVLKANGEDAYVLGEVVKSEEGVEIC